MHNAKKASAPKNVDVTQLMGEIDVERSKVELEKFKEFLVDFQTENGRRKRFNFVMDILSALTLSQELDTMFKKLKCAAKLNVAFGFLPKARGDGTCPYYYGRKNNTLMARSKFVATNQGLIKIKIC